MKASQNTTGKCLFRFWLPKNAYLTFYILVTTVMVFALLTEFKQLNQVVLSSLLVSFNRDVSLDVFLALLMFSATGVILGAL